MVIMKLIHSSSIGKRKRTFLHTHYSNF